MYTLSDSATPYTTRYIYEEIKVMWSKTWLPAKDFLSIQRQWFLGLQLYGVTLRNTIHFYHVINYFLLYPLLYGVVLLDSVM